MMFQINFDNIDEVNIVLLALGKLPLEQSLAVWQKVKTQAEKQLDEKE